MLLEWISIHLILPHVVWSDTLPPLWQDGALVIQSPTPPIPPPDSRPSIAGRLAQLKRWDKPLMFIREQGCIFSLVAGIMWWLVSGFIGGGGWSDMWEGIVGFYALFSERARPSRHYLHGKGHPVRKHLQACMLCFCRGKGTKAVIVNFYWSISRAPKQWPGGNEAIALVASMKYQACVAAIALAPILKHCL